MLELVDKQKLTNGLILSVYKTSFHNWWIAIFTSNKNSSEETRRKLEKMAWKKEIIKLDRKGYVRIAYVIRCYNKNSLSILIEEIKNITC